jgi:hypothetical protein
METAPKKPLLEKLEKSAPPIKVRLCWWFAIYSSGLAPLVVRAAQNEFNMLVPIFFPLPLGFVFAPVVNLLPRFFQGPLILPLYFAGFAFYAWHLYATLKATTRRKFDFLLLVLVVVVLANQWIMWSMATGIRG